MAFYYNTFDSGRQGLATLYVRSRILHSSPESRVPIPKFQMRRTLEFDVKLILTLWSPAR